MSAVDWVGASYLSGVPAAEAGDVFASIDPGNGAPPRNSYLEGLLERLLAVNTVEILPSGRALEKYAG